MAEQRNLRKQVAEQAGHCCEYCQLPRRLVSLPFQLDHVIAEKHGGAARAISDRQQPETELGPPSHQPLRGRRTKKPHSAAQARYHTASR